MAALGNMDIDSPDFKPTSTFYDLVSTHSLEELITLEQNLSSEIRELDSNMQTLVYENYSKFISATDSIRQMKANVESMEAEMQSLEESLGRIETQSGSLEGFVGQPQGELKRLLAINENLQNIKFVMDLPGLLRSALEKNKSKEEPNFSEVVESYGNSVDFLMQHRKDDAFRSIYKESRDYVAAIRKRLWQKIVDGVNDKLFDRYVRELRILGDTSDSLATHFLTHHKQSITASVDLIKKEQGDKLLPDVEELPSSLSNSLDNVEEDVKLKLVETSRLSIGFDIVGSFNWFINQLHTTTFARFIEALRTYSNVFKGEFPSLMQDFCRDTLTVCILFVKSSLPGLTVDINSLSLVLSMLMSDMTQLKKMFPPMNYFNVEDRVSELYEFVIRSQVERAMEQLCMKTAKFLQILHVELQTSKGTVAATLAQAVENCSYNLIYLVISTLMEIQPLMDCYYHCLGSGAMFVNLVNSHLVQFFHKLEQMICGFSMRFVVDRTCAWMGEMSNVPASGLLLVACFQLEACLVEKGIEKVVKAIHDSYNGEGGHREDLLDLMDRVTRPEIVSTLKHLQEETIRIYAEFSGQSAISLLQPYYAHLETARDQEPTDVSPEIVAFVNAIHHVVSETKLFLGEIKAQGQRHLKRQKTKYQVEIEMDRLYAKKADVFAAVLFRTESVLSAVLKIALKSVVEEVRQVTLPGAGLQQVQVDTAFVLTCFQDLVASEDQSLLAGMLYEVVYSAKKRARETQDLPQTAIESIVEYRRSTLKQADDPPK